MWRKQICIISQFFTCKHKINKSYAKVPTHYWIVFLYSKNISFYVFISDKFFNFFRNIFNTKTIKINNVIFCKIKQSNVCLHLHFHQDLLYMPHPLLFLAKLFLKKKSWFIFIIFLYFKICYRIRQHLKSHCFLVPILTIPFPFLFPEPAVTIAFPVNKFSNKLAPKVANKILKNPPFYYFLSILIVLVITFIKILELSRAWITFIISFISLFEIIKVVFPEPCIFFEFLHQLLRQQL